jgi:hypothetical protein
VGRRRASRGSVAVALGLDDPTLRVVRDIDQWFRGIDFETIDGSSPDVEQARESRLLDNIVASTHIEVE